MSTIETAGPIQMIRREYDPELGRTSHRNDLPVYQLVLPYSRGKLRAERDGVLIHDGSAGPGMVRVVAPGEQSALLVRSRFESVTALVPTSVFEATWGGGTAAALHAARREVARLCPSFVSALELRGRRRDLVVEGLTNALIGLMLGGPSEPGSGAELSEAQFAFSASFAEDRLHQSLLLEDWAATLGMETKTFSRLFAEHTGSSPYAWFVDRRIAEAKRILGTTDQSIADVALDLGFSSQSHFNDAFKKRTGLAPGVWRSRSAD